MPVYMLGHNTAYNFIHSLYFTGTCLKEIIMSLWWADFVCFHYSYPVLLWVLFPWTTDMGRASVYT